MRIITLTLLIASLVLSGCAQSSTETTERLIEPAEARQLKVMTYNVNYGIAGDLDTILAIQHEDADLVLLQETNAAWERALREHLASMYPHMLFEHCCGAGGLAVLSKAPLESGAYLAAPGDGWFPAWRVVAETPIGHVQVLNVHLRPPLSNSGSVLSGYFSTPSVRVEEISSHVHALEDGMPTLVAGDFNEDASGRAVRTLESRGIRTVLPEFHPGEKTWRWNTSVGTVRAQLDHIAYDRAHLHPLEAYVLDAGRSDHVPVVAVFTQK